MAREDRLTQRALDETGGSRWQSDTRDSTKKGISSSTIRSKLTRSVDPDLYEESSVKSNRNGSSMVPNLNKGSGDEDPVGRFRLLELSTDDNSIFPDKVVAVDSETDFFRPSKLSGSGGNETTAGN